MPMSFQNWGPGVEESLFAPTYWRDRPGWTIWSARGVAMIENKGLHPSQARAVTGEAAPSQRSLITNIDAFCVVDIRAKNRQRNDLPKV
jgi:hypothetical protein